MASDTFFTSPIFTPGIGEKRNKNMFLEINIEVIIAVVRLIKLKGDDKSVKIQRMMMMMTTMRMGMIFENLNSEIVFMLMMAMIVNMMIQR